MQELKSCPCCGSSNGLYVLQEDEYGEWSVFCDMCKTSFHNENHCETRDDAVSAWNRRAERTCRVEVSHGSHGPGPRFEGDVWTMHHVCSECDGAIDRDDAYCKHCGAKVVG